MTPSLETLLELTEGLLREKSLDKSLGLVTDTILALFPVSHHSSIRLLDAGGKRLLSGARSGAGEGSRPVSLTPGEGLAGWVVEHGERVLVEDTKEDPRFVVKEGQGFKIRSMMLVPMFAPDMVVGVVGCTARKPNVFSLRDGMLLQLVANCAAPAILRARLRHLATTDDTTQALNQRALFPRLESEIDVARMRGVPLSILLLDLDHFKQVNDSWGHAAGDRVLAQFANRVRGAIRQHDVFVRRGGEEFVVILPQTPEKGAVGVAERIRESLASAPVVLESGQEVVQTVSIGVAEWVIGDTAPDLEQRADHAMYKAKRAGRNQVMVADFDD